MQFCKNQARSLTLRYGVPRISSQLLRSTASLDVGAGFGLNAGLDVGTASVVLVSHGASATTGQIAKTDATTAIAKVATRAGTMGSFMARLYHASRGVVSL